MTFTNTDKRKAAQREAGYRLRVYDRLVASGKLTREKADYEIAIMTQIAVDYLELERRETPTLDLGTQPMEKK